MAGARSRARSSTCSSSRALKGVPSWRRRCSVRFGTAMTDPFCKVPAQRPSRETASRNRPRGRPFKPCASRRGSMARPAGSDAVAIEFDMPPLATNHEGRMRGVGVELEFAGLTAAAAAEALRAAFGGRLVEEDPHAYAIEGSELGDLAVRLDLRYVHAGRSDDSLLGRVEAKLTEWLGPAPHLVVPREL